MPKIDEVDPFANDPVAQSLTAQLPSWRNEMPPPYLKARIASAIAPPRHNRAGRLLLATCACVAAVVAALVLPSFLTPPRPAFAEVERSMKAVKSLSYRSTVELQFADGTWEHQTSQTWIRRDPPAYASRLVEQSNGKELRTRMLTTATQRITRNESTGKRTAYPSKEGIPGIVGALFVYTQSGKDRPQAIPPKEWVLSPWEKRQAMLGDKPTWLFTRKIDHRGETTLLRLWADADTHRVVRCEIDEAQRHVVNTDFHYDEPLEPEIFQL